jgi:hypothetical protein
MSKLTSFFTGGNQYVKVDDKNRFYYMLQQMQANRWRITAIVLGLFFFIILGINSAVFFGVDIQEDWKEMLLILLGAFVGNLNKVVDYWFNSEDRDKMLIQKVDEEDGVSLSNAGEYAGPQKPKPTNVVPVVEINEEPQSEEVVEEVVEEIVVPTSEKVEIDEDGDGVADGYDTDGDGVIDEYFPHRHCQHVWGDQDNDGDEECLICGVSKPLEG